MTDVVVETKLHTLSDGRILAYSEFGDPNGIALFYAHGSPGSRLEGELYHEKAAEYGFRFIATDRPGFGQSTLKKDRVLLDYPKDISELADALGIEKFGVTGHSGGGAHTTVCAYSIPERLLFNIPLAGYTNFAELPGAANMLGTKADQMSVGLSQKHPRLFKLFFDMMAFSAKHMPEIYFKEVAKVGNEADRKITANPIFKAHLIADQQEAMVNGGEGVTVDAAIHYLDWGFRLAEIKNKVIIFHGDEDTMVPLQFAQHLAENIPNSELHVLAGEGHLFPWTHQDMIFKTAVAQCSP